MSDRIVDAVDRAARASYGRLVAILASRSGDVAAAEDALHDAFESAFIAWRSSGIPANPEGWLIQAARRRLIDGARREAVAGRAEPALRDATSLATTLPDENALPDRRLELLLACAHPAIDPTIRTPLMLQVVMGLDADVVAAAFLAAPAAMAQRLVRAKRKIRDAGIPFEVPAREHLPARLDAVLEAIYGAFGAGWDAIDGSDPATADLAHEALYLGRLVVHLLPDEPEPRGLVALMLYCEARRATRRDAGGAFVPLVRQDPSAWDRDRLAEAESMLVSAARLLRPGRFQIEAAIQSAHVAPAFGRAVDHAAIVALYDALVHFAPTAGAMVGRAAALARVHGAEAGLAAVEALLGDAMANYQPWWVIRARLLHEAGREADAREARARAVGLTRDPAVRDFLLSAQSVTARGG